jgi:hypothetical protein
MSSGRNQEQQDNPFAPPPEGTPERPWQPRFPLPGQGTDQRWGPAAPPQGDGNGRDSGSGADGTGQGDEGQGGPSGQGQPGEGEPGPWGPPSAGPPPGAPGAWGPPPGGPGPWGPDGPGAPGQGHDPQNPPPSPWQPPRRREAGPRGPRFDITDPVQRRARYALLCGLWAFFFVLYSIPQVSLLLGALALYWGISSLRAKPNPKAAAVGGGQPPARPHFGSAVSGVVSGAIAVALVLATFSLQIAYRDYFDCVSDSLTSASRHACNEQIPSWVVNTVGVKD